MKVAVGDVLIYGKLKTWAEYDVLTERFYFAGTWSEFLLHEALRSDESYLGLLEVHFADGAHLALFRNSMILLYRIEGATLCRPVARLL